jgi:hypothetical protein
MFNLLKDFYFSSQSSTLSNNQESDIITNTPIRVKNNNKRKYNIMTDVPLIDLSNTNNTDNTYAKKQKINIKNNNYPILKEITKNKNTVEKEIVNEMNKIFYRFNKNLKINICEDIKRNIYNKLFNCLECEYICCVNVLNYEQNICSLSDTDEDSENTDEYSDDDDNDINDGEFDVNKIDCNEQKQYIFINSNLKKRIFYRYNGYKIKRKEIKKIFNIENNIGGINLKIYKIKELSGNLETNLKKIFKTNEYFMIIPDYVTDINKINKNKKIFEKLIFIKNIGNIKYNNIDIKNIEHQREIMKHFYYDIYYNNNITGSIEANLSY